LQREGVRAKAHPERTKKADVKNIRKNIQEKKQKNVDKEMRL